MMVRYCHRIVRNREFNRERLFERFAVLIESTSASDDRAEVGLSTS